MTASREPGSRARRLPADERRREILEAGAVIALSDGFGKVTARSLADTIGVRQGLVVHYFPTIDLLLAEIFRTLGASGRLGVGLDVDDELSPTDRLGRLVRRRTTAERDPVALLWLDAWRQAADRPRLREAVTERMEADVADLTAVLERGVGEGEFEMDDPTRSAMRILGLLDGQIVASVIRAAAPGSSLDYAAVVEMTYESVERELGLREALLRR